MKRQWILWLLVLAFGWVVYSNLAQARQLAQTLAGGKWPWLLAAAISQIGYFVIFTASYQAAFDTVEVKSRLLPLIPVTLSSLFVNVVAPSGGASGGVLFVDDLSRRGQPGGRVTVGVFLQLIADYGAFALILVFGLLYLFRRHDLHLYELIAAVFLILLIGALSAVLALSLVRPGAVSRLLFWVQARMNRLLGWLRQEPLPQGWAEQYAVEFNEASRLAARHPGRLARTVALALAFHGVNILSLYLLFRGFNYDIGFSPLVGGYAVGVLFLIVSITPMGIGVVESLMPLVYVSLGAPSPVAAAVVLSFRGMTFWLPLVLGFILLRRIKTFRSEEQTLGEAWMVRLIALLTLGMALINVLSAVTPALAERLARLEPLLPLVVQSSSRLATALAGLALVYLSRGLWRRKQAAWALSLAVLALSTISHMLKGLDYEEALAALGLMGLLWRARFSFHARSDPPSVRQAFRVMGAALLFTVAYGAIGFYMLDRHYRMSYSLLAAIRQTLVMFTQFYDPGLEPLTGYGRYFADSIYLVGAVALGSSALLLLRPVFLRRPATPDERARAETIVQAYARSTLARMLLFDDKAYFFTPGGSVIGYVVRAGVAVALGDPVGPPEDLSDAVRGFQEMCAQNDWAPCFYQARPENLPVYRAAGLDAISAGQDAIVDLHTFKLEGPAAKKFRNAYNHLLQAGCHFQVNLPPHSPALMKELRAISDEWLTVMHGSEKRFSLGWFDDDYLQSCPIALVIDQHGSVSAFANLLTEYQRNELTIDLMRRRKEVEAGTMDFLFVGLLLWAKEQGYDSFNLGLSSLAGVGEAPTDPAVEKALHFVFEHVSQFYNFKGLHEFKDKFHPRWEDRLIIYPNAGMLARVLVAIVAANMGDEGWIARRLK